MSKRKNPGKAIPYKNLDFGGGLLRQIAQRRHYVGAIVFACVLIAATLLALPLSQVILPQTNWYMPASVAVSSFAKGLSALILLLQFYRTGRWALAFVTFAFLFSASAAFGQMMMFPGIFSAAGMFGASIQSSPWMWVCAHLGFAGFVLLAALAVNWNPIAWSRRLGMTIGTLLMPVVATALLIVLVTRFVYLLPDLLRGNSYGSLGHGPAGIAVWLAGWIALTTLGWRTRFRTRLQIWVGASLLTYLCETSLVLIAIRRFSIGWYFSGTVTLLATSVLLVVLVFELDDLYGSVNDANDELHERSIRDGLTGTFVRRYLNEQLNIEMGRARRLKQPLSILLMDVDLFKHYNDRFGHQAGDECLIAVCDAAQRHLRRHGDFLSRYGGEEFAVVLPNTQAFAAAELAERIREEIAGLQLHPSNTGEPATITISIGVATGDPNREVDEHALLETADVALYDAKKAGRNRVVVGVSDVREPVLHHSLS